MEIKGEKIIGLLDSGAQSTVVGKDFIELINKLELERRNILAVIKTADGTAHVIKESVILPIKFNDQEFCIEALLAPSISKPLILGSIFGTHLKSGRSCAMSWK